MAEHRGRPLRVIITGGGTGGHLYPGIAVAAHLRAAHPDAEVLFIGARGRMESDKVPRAGYRLVTIDVHGLAGSLAQGVARRLRSLAELALGLPLWQSAAIIRRFRADVVVGTGGYVCGPVLLAAWLLRVPGMVLDQNEHPGWTTRILAHFAQVVLLVSEASAQRFRPVGGWRSRRARIEAPGNPVRPELLMPREAACRRLGLDPSRTVLLVTGGSLGSRAINRAFVEALPRLAETPGFRERAQIVHVTGRANPIRLDDGRAAALGLDYRALDYLDEMPAAVAAADLVVTRAGGTFLAEITARGVAAIVIPWAQSADEHQVENARRLAEAGAAVMIRDQDLDAESLGRAIAELVSNPDRRRAMAERARALGRPEAGARVVAWIEQLADRRRRRTP
jgi:UDP-N-acetylglucosamine--N-acetylmuramyl-(pentapeptide) pyrophosphoryl-undecaprenol N-acetylglucosamine transferase